MGLVPVGYFISSYPQLPKICAPSPSTPQLKKRKLQHPDTKSYKYTKKLHYNKK